MKVLTPQEQAATIAKRAKFIANCCDAGVGPPRLQRLHLAQLSRALKAMESPKWRLAIVQLAIVQVIGSPADHLAAGRIAEDVAVRRATEAIKGVGGDRAVAAEHRSYHAPRALVLECLRAWPRKGGRGRAGGSKYSALHALFLELGIARGGPMAIKQLLLRRARARRKP